MTSPKHEYVCATDQSIRSSTILDTACSKPAEHASKANHMCNQIYRCVKEYAKGRRLALYTEASDAMVKIKELLEYNDRIRRRYFKSLTLLPWSEFVKDKGASWGSIRNIFVHTLFAIDYWLDFLNREETRSKKKLDEFGNFEDVKTYMEHVETRMRNYLNLLPRERLKKKYTLKKDANKTIEITAEDILIHVFEEEVHHRGEIIALLWQMNIEPPPMGWKEL